MELLISTGLRGTDAGLVSFGIVVLTRWLMIGLFVSVVALLLVAGAVATHVRRQRRLQATESADLDRQKVQNRELDRALELHETMESKESRDLSSHET